MTPGPSPGVRRFWLLDHHFGRYKAIPWRLALRNARAWGSRSWHSLHYNQASGGSCPSCVGAGCAVGEQLGAVCVRERFALTTIPPPPDTEVPLTDPAPTPRPEHHRPAPVLLGELILTPLEHPLHFLRLPREVRPSDPRRGLTDSPDQGLRFGGVQLDLPLDSRGGERFTLPAVVWIVSWR